MKIVDRTDYNKISELLNQYPYLLLVDLEATCSEDNSIAVNEFETIEIGAVMVCTKQLIAIDEFECLIKPVQHPILTDFCTQLTGITQAEVDQADNFSKAFNAFISWLKPCDDYLFCSWGAYDSVQLAIDCQYHQLNSLAIDRELNLKKAFAKIQKVKPRVGMKRAMQLAGLTIDGRAHRALDDVKNISKLLPFIFGFKNIKRENFSVKNT